MTGHRATLAGTLVTGTACLVTLLAAITTCVLYLREDISAAKEAGALATALFTATVALLAVTGRPTSEPVQVTTAPGDSVTVNETPTEPVASGDLTFDDSGHVDILTALVVVFVCVCILLVLGVL